MKKLIIIAAFNVFLLASVGSVVSVKGNVEVIRNGSTHTPSVNYALEENDKILTKNNGKISIKFIDNTKVTLGKNSILEINKYLINGANSQVKLKTKRGSYDVVSGNISKLAKENFEFQANTASIGIRGTSFSGNLENKFVECREGEIDVKIEGKVYNVKEGNRLDYKNSKMIKIQKLQPTDFYMIRL